MDTIIIVAVLAVAVSFGDALKCYHCNNFDSESCGLDFWSMIEPQTCNQTGSTACYAAKTADGYTERGCTTTSSSTKNKCKLEHFKGSCLTCVNDSCNGKLPQPIYCYNCSSDTDATCAYAVTNNIKCDYFEICQTVIDNDRVYRGCASRSNITCVHPYERSNSYCSVCDKSRCNNDTWTAPTEMKCYDCMSNETSSCGYDFNPTIAKTSLCNPLYKNPVCVTATMKASHLVQRFCSNSELNPCTDENYHSCDTCNDTLCNVPKGGKSLKCHCQSLDESDCKKQADDNGSIECGNVFDDPVCYVATLNGTTLRGCTTKRNSICNKEEYKGECNVCYTENCNAASVLKWSFPLAVATVYFATLNL